MPIKKRTAKRRVDPDQEATTWGSVFDAGYDFFGELPGIGVETDNYGRPDRDGAREAWMRLGARYLADGEHTGRWALDCYGEPHAG